MAAGARLATERGFWPEAWRVADLEPEEERLLDELETGEELCAAVPAFVSGYRDIDVPALVGVTERRLLLLTRSADGTVAVTDATRCARHLDRTAPIPFRDRELRLDGNIEHVARLWSLVEELGAASGG
jgi:hypothetical protein